MLVGLTLVGLTACSGAPALRLPAWTLVVDGAETAARDVTLPTHLDDGRVPGRPLAYTLSTRAELPPELRGTMLRLVVPELPANVRVTVDGQPALDLSTARSGGYRRRGPQEWAIPAATTADGLVELTLSVEHRWTQSAWWETVPRLVPLEAVDANALTVDLFNLYASGAALVALLQIGITCIMVFIIDRRRLPYLWFGIQALAAAWYPLFVVGWSQRLVGTYDTSILAITLSVAATASVHFTHGFFGLARPWRGWWPLCGLVSLIAIVFHGAFIATRVAGVATVPLLALLIGYQVLTCSRLVTRGGDRRSALYSLASWLGLAATGAPDFVYWLGLGDLLHGARSASIGLALFGLFLSLLLSQKHITSMSRADELNVELGQRVDQLEKRRAEIEQLNNELRRQIADRASQIYAAVALANAQTSSARELVAGEIVQGRYRVERPIGSGGMGTVYEVTRLGDGRKLALKLAREVHGESLARLAREAQMASTIAHPNIVGILDVDVASSGFLFLVMELIEGTSLYEHREHYGEVGWAVPVLRQIADGLAALHRAGVVHRDLKPGNVLITPLAGGVPGVKISDFGIALNPETERFTKPSTGDPRESSSAGLARSLAAQPLEPHAAPTTAPPAAAATTATRGWFKEITTKETVVQPLPRALAEAGKQRAPAASTDSREQATEVLTPGALARVAGRDPGSSPSSGSSLPGSSFLTRTGFLPGTPSYIAPELIEGREMLTPAADVFAFGVIAHELVTGGRPFAEPPVLALLERRPVPAPRSLSGSWAECPTELTAALDACLSMDPLARPSAAELSRLLAQPLVQSGARPGAPNAQRIETI